MRDLYYFLDIISCSTNVFHLRTDRLTSLHSPPSPPSSIHTLDDESDIQKPPSSIHTLDDESDIQKPTSTPPSPIPSLHDDATSILPNTSSPIQQVDQPLTQQNQKTQYPVLDFKIILGEFFKIRMAVNEEYYTLYHEFFKTKLTHGKIFTLGKARVNVISATPDNYILGVTSKVKCMQINISFITEGCIIGISQPRKVYTDSIFTCTFIFENLFIAVLKKTLESCNSDIVYLHDSDPCKKCGNSNSKRKTLFSCFVCNRQIHNSDCSFKNQCKSGCGSFKVKTKHNISKFFLNGRCNDFYDRLYAEIMNMLSMIPNDLLEKEKELEIEELCEENEYLEPPKKPPAMVHKDQVPILENHKMVKVFLREIVQEVMDYAEEAKELGKPVDHKAFYKFSEPKLSSHQENYYLEKLMEGAKIMEEEPMEPGDDPKTNKERKKSKKKVANESFNDTVRALKADNGKLTEINRIERLKCEKLYNYCTSVERQMVRIQDGQPNALKDLVFNQYDHARIAMMAQQLNQTVEMFKQNNSLLQHVAKQLTIDPTLINNANHMQGTSDTEGADNNNMCHVTGAEGNNKEQVCQNIVNNANTNSNLL